MVRVQPTVNMLRLLSTTNRQLDHIRTLQVFKEQHNQKFHNKFFYDLIHTKSPIQNHIIQQYYSIRLYFKVLYPYELYLFNANRPLLLKHLLLYLLFLFHLKFFFSLIGKIGYLLAYIQVKGRYFLNHQKNHKAEEYFNVDRYFEF